MHILLRILPIGIVLLSSLSAEAAIVGGVKGDVYVNRGAGYQRVESFAEIGAGDSVMAGPAGYATVTYGDGCAVQLAPGAVIAVGDVSPCSIETGANPPSPGGGPDLTTLGTGALVVGGIAGAVVLLSDDDSKGGGSGGSGSGGPSSGEPGSAE